MNLEKMSDEELSFEKDKFEKEQRRRKAQEKLDWHRGEIKRICQGELPEENICEWCGANHTRGEECDETAHYLNR